MICHEHTHNNNWNEKFRWVNHFTVWISLLFSVCWEEKNQRGTAGGTLLWITRSFRERWKKKKKSYSTNFVFCLQSTDGEKKKKYIFLMDDNCSRNIIVWKKCSRIVLSSSDKTPGHIYQIYFSKFIHVTVSRVIDALHSTIWLSKTFFWFFLIFF